MTAKYFKFAPLSPLYELSPLYKFSPLSLLKLPPGAIRSILGNPDVNSVLLKTIFSYLNNNFGTKQTLNVFLRTL